jgi:hypothetical protein
MIAGILCVFQDHSTQSGEKDGGKMRAGVDSEVPSIYVKPSNGVTHAKGGFYCHAAPVRDARLPCDSEHKHPGL